MDKILNELSKVDGMGKFFVYHSPVEGFLQPDRTIYDSPEFIEWKESAKYYLSTLKPSNFIDETIDLLDKFTGWTDEEDLIKLQARIHIILDHPEDFLTEGELETMEETKRLSKGITIHTAFNDYELVKQIGQGGNGRVFAAKDSDGTDVAIKFVERDGSEKKYKRLKNEINFCEKSKHKNIIHIIDRGIAFLDEKYFVFYVMPLYPDTLRKRIEQGINPDDAICIFIGIISGLEYAHKKGTIHRDIKPENILFAQGSNDPVICDFGIAHFSEDELLTLVETKPGDRLANFQYAAPEQRIKGGANAVTGKADVYAAGLILNEMFTGEIPQSMGYKKIADVNPEYAFLDKLFEELYLNDPDARLFPTNKILKEIKVLADYHQNEKAKRQLEQSAISATEIKEYAIAVINKFYENDELVFVLDRNPNQKWFSILTKGNYTHTVVFGYETQSLKLHYDRLIMPLRGSSDENTIKKNVENVTSWIQMTNSNYNTMLKKEAEKKQQQEEYKRKKELEELDRRQSINSILKEL